MQRPFILYYPLAPVDPCLLAVGCLDILFEFNLELGEHFPPTEYTFFHG